MEARTATVKTGPAQQDRRWWILAVLCLSVLLVVVDNTIVNVALPTISRDLSASTSALQWVVDGYTLSFAGLLLVGGNLGDRLGRRRFLQLGLVLFAATSVGAALSRSTGELIAARAAMGLAAALVYPATLAILNNVFTVARERVTAIGIWSAVSGLAVAIGPVAGGALLRHFSWSSVFYVSVPVVMLAVAAGRFLLPESRDPDAGRFDPLGAVLSAAGIALLTYSIIEAPARGWGSAATLGGILGALAVLSAFAWWQARRPDPMLDVRLFRNPRFSAASAAIALAFFGLFGFIFMITQFFQVVRGYDPLGAGLATLPFAFVTAGFSPVAMLLMSRFGTKLVVAAGLATMSAGFVVAATTEVDAPYWGKVIIAMALMAAGLGLTTGPATEAIMGALPPGKARRRLGRQRHHPRGRRHPRRRDHRLGAELRLRLARAVQPDRAGRAGRGRAPGRAVRRRRDERGRALPGATARRRAVGRAVRVHDRPAPRLGRRRGHHPGRRAGGAGLRAGPANSRGSSRRRGHPPHHNGCG